MRGFSASIACGRWLLFAITAVALGTPSLAAEPSELEHQLDIDGRPVSLTEAMDILNVPSVSFAVIDDGDDSAGDTIGLHLLRDVGINFISLRSRLFICLADTGSKPRHPKAASHERNRHYARFSFH